MDSTAMWTTIATERSSLADDLGGLSEAQWATTSWASPWTVRDVVAHMTASSVMNPPQFFGKLVASGFSFTTLTSKDIARERGASSAETLSRFRAQVSSRRHPPGPTTTWLGETLVHAEDVRRPLGIRHEYPTPAAVQVADFYKGSNLLIGSKRRIAGLRLAATDAEWSTGQGPAVEGPIVSLVLAMTGRPGALEDLKGDGVATLRGRSGAPAGR
jgi:uncharacterized protein (TIGR03083 family)